MTNEKIEALSQLGTYIKSKPQKLEEQVQRAFMKNRWFTPENTWQSLEAISDKMLNKQKLDQWLSNYDLPEEPPLKKVGLVLAGNLPLVGFHDVLTVMLSGNRAVIKLSSKDNQLLPHLLDELIAIDGSFAKHFEVVEKLTDIDAVIATGSNNTARYFEYYFGNYPNIIRKNRNSVAVLTGDETEEDYMDLGKDIFSYFGMGCRNVSKLYLPKGFQIPELLDGLEPFKEVMQHSKYQNNFDYHRSLLLINNEPHFTSDFLMMMEKEAIASPMAILHYEFYENKSELKAKLDQHQEEIQVIVSKDKEIGEVPLDKAQEPELWDYADKVDTMAFLLDL